MNPLERVEGFGTKVGRTVFPRMARYRRVSGFGLAACVGTVLAASALPVSTPGPGSAGNGPGIRVGKDLPTLVPEDLSLFLDSRRWGGETLQEVRQRVAEAEAAAAGRRTIDKVGLVGLVNVEDRRASLIRFPDGAVARFAPGDTLPDGRSVKAATDRTVTLEEDAEGEAEVLDLFPPLPQDPRLAESDTEIQGQPVEPEAAPSS